MVEIYVMQIEQLYSKEIFQEKLCQIDGTRRQKVERYRNQADQCRSLGAGLLLQYAINNQKQTEVLELEYECGIDGKPYLKGFPNLFFNLSHSGNYVALATSDEEVGVDIQEITVMKRDIAKRFFTVAETRLLDSIMDEKKRNQVFFKLWSVKESYLKLTGKGLAQGLSTFCIKLEEGIIWEESTKEKIAYFKEFAIEKGTNVLMVCSRNNEFGKMKIVE